MSTLTLEQALALDKTVRKTREDTIEECARVVMPFDPSGEMAKAIRALKNKP